jgi:heme-degrading monooxygenase HmoA
MAIAVSVTSSTDQAGYDEIISHIGSVISQQEGFLFHYAHEGERGWVVTEIWESPETQTAWFDANVRDHLPPDAEVLVTHLHNTVGPKSAKS